MESRSRKAYEYVLASTPVRRRGDDRSRLMNLFVAKIRFEPNGEHWVWTSVMARRAGRDHDYRNPRFSHSTHNGTRQAAAFPFLVRHWFPTQPAPRNARWGRTCDEQRCISPYHHAAQDLSAVRALSRRTLTEETAELVLRRALAGENQRIVAEEFGITQQSVAQIKRGASWPAVWERVTGLVAPRKHRKPKVKREYAYEPRVPKRHAARVTEAQRRAVLELWARRPVTRLRIAEAVGLHPRTVGRVIREASRA